MKKCPEKKWMYVVADCDLSKEFENEFNSVEDAMAKLCKRGFLAVEVRGAIFLLMLIYLNFHVGTLFQVNSCRAIADKSFTSGSLTACYEERKRNGLVTRHGIFELLLGKESTSVRKIV